MRQRCVQTLKATRCNARFYTIRRPSHQASNAAPKPRQETAPAHLNMAGAAAAAKLVGADVGVLPGPQHRQQVVWRRGGGNWPPRLALWPLASCVSPEELLREDETTRSEFGFHPGTDAFASCLQKESLARHYWAAPPAPYWGRRTGTVLAVVSGSGAAASRSGASSSAGSSGWSS